MDRGVLIEDVLGWEDGPHPTAAALFLAGRLCDECHDAEAELDDLCLMCARVLTTEVHDPIMQ